MCHPDFNMRNFQIFVVFCISLLAGSVGCGEHTALPEEGYVQTDDAGIYFITIGRGEPLLLIHGGPGMEHTYLRPYIDRLANHFELIYYDQRATGRSEGEADSATITIATFVSDIEAVRKSLGIEKVNILGHSWGGLLAMFYALEYPDHVRSLILVSTAGASSDYYRPYFANLASVYTHEDSLELIRLTNSENFYTGDSEIIEQYYRIAWRRLLYDVSLIDKLNLSVTEKTAINGRHIPFLLFRELAEYDIHDRIATLNVPTLLIHGEHDSLPWEVSQKIHNYMRLSEFHLFEECGHFPYLEQPDEFINHIVSFKKSLEKTD
jgi:proline iminopeptidase